MGLGLDLGLVFRVSDRIAKTSSMYARKLDIHIQDECDRLTAVAMKQTLGRQVVSTVPVKHILLLQCGPQAAAGPAPAPACGPAPAPARWDIPMS